MLFSAPLDVARTKAWTVAPSSHERVGEVRAHEAVGAGDEDGAAVVDVAELAAEIVERGACPEGVVRHGPYASASVRKRTDSSGLGSLASAALTAASTLVVTRLRRRSSGSSSHASSAGRTRRTVSSPRTASSSSSCSRRRRFASPCCRHSPAREGARDSREPSAGFATALAVVSLPLLLVGVGGAGAIADLLTGSGSAAARGVCADALRWIVPAAIAHLFAGLAASGLAALDDYATAALGYALGSTAALTMILTRVDDDGIVALWWGVALNGAISLAVPVVGLAWRALRARMPAASGAPDRDLRCDRRLGIFARRPRSRSRSSCSTSSASPSPVTWSRAQ